MEDARYNRTARVLHWLIALLLLGQFIFGWWLGDVPRNTPERAYFTNMHKSTGLVLALLILLRIGWRLGHRPPPLPATVSPWQVRLARVSHLAMYALMLVVPLAGYLGSNFSKYGVKLFNTVLLPPWGVDDRQIYAVFNQTHKIGAAVLLALILVHILAAIRHAWRRDAIFSRIWLRPF